PEDGPSSPREVAYRWEAPLDHLMAPVTFAPDRRIINGREIVFQSYRWQDDLIWGATARMLSNFLDLVRATE
ncbi:MAG TPA: hypothetical protein PKD27_14160, partial [Tepidiformaceae bacterium]|nr:hypothetical protein [Tepidiformaceae bacterium]